MQGLWASRKTVCCFIRHRVFLPNVSLKWSYGGYLNPGHAQLKFRGTKPYIQENTLMKWWRLTKCILQNSQQRSFIEQQMMLYSSTGCFGKSKEVLRRDVEIVEYLNDLIDLFR